MSVYLTQREEEAMDRCEAADFELSIASEAGRSLRAKALELAIERKNGGGSFKSVTGTAAVYARFIDTGETAASQR